MEKLIALAQHLGLEVFEFSGEYYTGATQDEINALEDSSSDTFDEAYIEHQYMRLDDQITNEYDNVFEYEGAEYLVLDDDEADQAWDDAIYSFIDDVVLPEIPENYQRYFDTEAFKKDCSYDGRGHTLATYDSEENEETVNGTTYYIYRTN